MKTARSQLDILLILSWEIGSTIKGHNTNCELQAKKSAMTDQRFHLLEQLGFHWGGNIDQTPWEERYIELLAFREDSGHTQVSVRDPEHGHLGHWIYNQRAQYKLRKQGRPSSMTDERAEALESIGLFTS
mmetsp:Transcript_24898/g.57450  ORF Transcript_24898/g.57450 Transcript_24898/m.57450 type:complete len:130 (-) Transcript_24898:222-611(-)